MSQIPPPARPALRDIRIDHRTLLLMAMAVVAGMLATLAGRLLLAMIALATNLAYHGRFSFAGGGVDITGLGLASVLVPVAGGLIIGLMARYGSEKIRGHGIPEAMEAILIGQSRIQPKVAILKPLSSAISIGTGGPFGAEGPIIMTGGALGSLFAQLFHLTPVERKTLLVAGAAAGMTAIFATPVAAVLLALELLLFEWKARSFLPVIVACAAAAVLRPLLFEAGPLFPVVLPAAMTAAGELPWAAGIGLVAGLLSTVLTAMVYGVEDLFGRLPLHWMWWPAIGGIVVGLGGLADPAALGVGYGNIGAALAGDMPLAAAVTLILVKAVIWSVALGSGTSGGVLAPLLIIGGMLGTLLAAVFAALVPGHAGLFALLGMAAVMSGTMRAPLTATLFAVELTGSLPPLLPLLAACGTAYAVTGLLMRRSILTEKVARRGLHVLQEYGLDPFATQRVGEVMIRDIETLNGAAQVADTVAAFAAGRCRHKAYPVTDADGRCLGIITRADILRWSRDGAEEGVTLSEVLADRELFHAAPGELVGDLADRMAAGDYARVPVIDPASRRLLGLMTRKDLLAVRSRVMRQESERAALLRPRRR
ncbi:chloride channel protein [Ferrovibrio xuzhouensis]|uniref:Chloride channel protein n=1 Tax=Ferrovibrio xuzhouensis TaxID=1576914 RepID=A0ABV7VDV3_9PROT